MYTIKSVEELKKFISETGYEQGDLEMQENWICTICGEGLKNFDLIFVYNVGCNREGYVCESCWDKAFEEGK